MVEDTPVTPPPPPAISADESRGGISNLLSQNYQFLSSSWNEGLSSLIPTERIRRYIGLGNRGNADGESADAICLTLIQDLIKKAPDIDVNETLWFISYLIGGECNTSESVFGGYSLWDDVLDSITLNRATIMSGSEDPERNLLSIFVRDY